MKKVWLVVFVFCMIPFGVKASDPGRYAEIWADSIFDKLTIDEQIGQLLDLEVAPDFNNLDKLVSIISKYNIGSITIVGGQAAATIELLNRLQPMLKVPLYVTASNDNSLDLPLTKSAIFPLPSTFVQANDSLLLAGAISLVSNKGHQMSVNGITYNPVEMHFAEKDMYFTSRIDGWQNSLFDDYAVQKVSNDMIINTDIYFDFNKELGFSPKALDGYNSQEWQEKTEGIKARWQKNNFFQSVITIKALPGFPEAEAIFFNRKIIDPLFWKHLGFKGILSADFESITINQPGRKNESTIRSLIKIGADKIRVSSKPEMAFSAIMDGLNGRYFKQNEIKGKIKRLLMLKYYAGLAHQKPVSIGSYALEAQKPAIETMSYQVYAKAVKKIESGTPLMPFLELSSTNFASLSLGFSDIKTFQETLDKYAPMVHYTLPDNSYNPYDLDVLQSQLIQFDNVIVGLHTSGLVELDGRLLTFLKFLNERSNVVLAFLGKSIELGEFSAFDHKIYAHEDNRMTQQIAAQYVFGALSRSPGVQRLTYSTPEMQEMDSRTLARIDEIANEAIVAGATPGCQILVARNGAVVLEKGYGYYTYDSIMPVDTRTMYDLASVTKVAATTQAIMKLVEEGKIDLGDSLGKYLPELSGSNKGNLVIREVLAHQSGLRAFYPFWKNTIEDQNQVLHYYKENPTDDHANEVAYGMFAGEDLKDSLWQWTIDTKLRTKRYSYKPYDYKYSDLGFYMMQVLAERVSGLPLDEYVDSVFYKNMGMSTLTFNPLCKFPMMRIAPTERDTEFRHGLIWGTVHDQIAAMKGGVSGHAGLFGNANDLAKIMQMQLQAGYYGGKQYLNKETVLNFCSRQYNNNRRGLGWDKPDFSDVKKDKYPTIDSFGHTGFTGTIVWADPTFNLVYVFLSNRIYPSISNNKLSDLEIRKRIQDVVYRSIGDYQKHYH